MKFFTVTGVTVSVAGGIALTSLLDGLVLSILWGWFIVPLGLPSISLALAVGVTLVVRYLTHHTTKEPKDDKSFGEKFATQILTSAALSGVFLLFGWFIHFFV